MPNSREHLLPAVDPSYCKGCARCIDACVHNCIEMGNEINPLTGLTPVVLHLENCSHCGLCVTACPEPYGLHMDSVTDDYSVVTKDTFTGITRTVPKAVTIPDIRVPINPGKPILIKGTYASSIGAVLAGCRHFYGYPITPSTEGAELMAKLLPNLDGIFIQAVSEVAAINMLYGTGGAGLPCMTFTSSPGFSLMLEGISYMIGAEVPSVVVNIMRGGPGLGNIAPEQSDIKLVCRGLGHGNTHAIVLAPATPQEMLDFTMLAFELTFKYRNPVILIGDGYLGQITGKVSLPDYMIRPGIPDWAVYGDADHRGNLIASIDITEADLEARNIRLNEKYARMAEAEQRFDEFYCDDAEILLVAMNTPAQMAKGAVQQLRSEGIQVGLFRPVTAWPFPVNGLISRLKQIRQIVVVEASNGQLEDEIRLALSKAGYSDVPPIEHVRRFGGILPQTHEIVEKIHLLEGAAV
ncbi:MAG: 3-methyl-2-oxobutanoate dehydrogenase subunit VorB [Bacteroidetes bacterium]|nr:3-methyl-2-oxobutanoate dehydrogenase subunit VorB [Bacteroidota bacterium]